MKALSMSFSPLRMTVTCFFRTVISKRFHEPTGLSARFFGVTAAFSSGEEAGFFRTPYISPEPTGQFQMLT